MATEKNLRVWRQWAGEAGADKAQVTPTRQIA